MDEGADEDVVGEVVPAVVGDVVSGGSDVAVAFEVEVDDAEVDQLLHAAAAQSEDPMGFLKAIRGTPQEVSLRSDMLRDKALKVILDNATPVDPDGNVVELRHYG